MHRIPLALLLLASSLPAVTTDGYGQVFPPDNPWNVEVTRLPVHPNSAAYVASIGAATTLHPDFGTTYAGVPWGIPYAVVPASQTPVRITYDAYGGESDPGPFPIPTDAQIEGGPSATGDRHVIVIDRDRRKLYELFAAYPQSDGSWVAASGAVFDLTSNAVRPAGWTSADAAGLPVFAGLVRYDEVAAGAIRHALRFTVVRSQRAYLYPARHYASSSTDASLPPMGLRVRLKASVDATAFSGQPRVIVECLKRYGMLLADNGGNWFVTGAPDPRWDDDAIDTLKRLRGSDFEAVDTTWMDPSLNTTPPSAPTGLAATPGDARASLTWTASTASDLLGYHVERAAAAGGPWTRQTTAPFGTPAFAQTGLGNGTTVWYRVIAEDYGRNFSAAGAAVAVTPVGAGTTTGTTTGGSATSGATTGGTGAGTTSGATTSGTGTGTTTGTGGTSSSSGSTSGGGSTGSTSGGSSQTRCGLGGALAVLALACACVGIRMRTR